MLFASRAHHHGLIYIGMTTQTCRLSCLQERLIPTFWQRRKEVRSCPFVTKEWPDIHSGEEVLFPGSTQEPSDSLAPDTQNQDLGGQALQILGGPHANSPLVQDSYWDILYMNLSVCLCACLSHTWLHEQKQPTLRQLSHLKFPRHPGPASRTCKYHPWCPQATGRCRLAVKTTCPCQAVAELRLPPPLLEVRPHLQTRGDCVLEALGNWIPSASGIRYTLLVLFRACCVSWMCLWMWMHHGDSMMWKASVKGWKMDTNCAMLIGCLFMERPLLWIIEPGSE